MSVGLRKKHLLAASKSSGGSLPFTFLKSVTSTPGPSGGSTGAIDTTGATFLLIQVAALGPGSFSDSKGNVWSSTSAVTSGSGSQQFFYNTNPIVGPGHTFTFTGSNVFPVIIALAFSNVISPTFHSQQDGIAAGSPAQTTTGVTPVVNNSLIVAGFASNTITSVTVDPDLTQITVLGVASVNITGSLGYKVQPVAAFVRPTWTFVGDTNAALKLVDFAPSVATSNLLIETGDTLLLETGDRLALE